MLLPLLKLSTVEFSNLISSVISLPLVAVFLIETIYEEFNVKSHAFALVGLSFVTFFVPRFVLGYPVIDLLALFLKALVLSLLIIYVYYAFFVGFSKSPLKISEKKILLVSYIFSLFLLIPLFILLSTFIQMG